MTIVMAAFFSACTSTEVIEPQQGLEQKGETITLNISCPDAAASTRAEELHDGHTLRYIALLYKGVELGKGDCVGRQEGTVDAEETKTFTFEVENGDYNCIVFADYIPSDSEPDSEGKYKDKYYNTQKLNEYVYMRSFIDFSTASDNGEKTTVEWNCFNNENYDCFIYTNKNIEKKDEEQTVDVTLGRIVSRVAIKSNTPLPEGVEVSSVTMTNFDFFGTYVVPSKDISKSYHADKKDLAIPSFTLDDTYDSESGELFFFYTFASNSEGQDVSLHEFNFDVNFSDENSYQGNIPSSKIKPVPNYKITVNGPFFSAPKPELGNLNLSVAKPDIEKWGNDKIEW